jgi:heptosyltransferase-1
LQGLIQSALIARTAGANTVWGFDRLFLREPLAAFFYTERATTPGPHRVTKNLQLVQAAGAHAITDQAWIPQGRMEGQLPKEPFVLTNPVAGWTGKQWPLSSYRELGQRLSKEGIPLVVNVPENEADRFVGDPAWSVHVSSLEGLISATRQASAIVGVDSGPLHLAAALHKPGVAIFGPTDPAANGPYGGTLTTLRAQDAETTYRRQSVVHSSMESITCEDVFQALMQQLQSPDGAPSRVPLGRTL